MDWNSVMFDDVGYKIKKVARIFSWIGIIGYIICGIVMLLAMLFSFRELWYFLFLAPITVFLGCLMSWLSVITLYGLGEMIDKVNQIERNTHKEIEEKKTVPAKTSTYSPINKELSPTLQKISPRPNALQKRSPFCGEIVKSERCDMCGKINSLY